MTRRTAASVFFLRTPLGKGYGGYLANDGVVSFLLLPVHKTATEAAARIRKEASDFFWSKPPSSLFLYLKAFFQGKPLPPSFPFSYADAPPFFYKVYQVCQKVPWGKTMTYAQIAEEVGNRQAARAVGQAMARNKLPLLVPCHRVVSQQNLGGFSYGVLLKQKLLQLERNG